MQEAPLVSIITPCYNHGKYIPSLLESLKALEAYNYELVIMNDGSTDEETLRLLNEITHPRVRVFHQPNQGLSTARNNAIKQTRGEYIIPLDSDNEVLPAMFAQALPILLKNDDYDIVYGDGELFGEKQGLIQPGSFNVQRLILDSYIDACALFRKKVWEKTGGFDEAPLIRACGEDWDFWITAHEKGFRFCYLNETIYRYRYTANSMSRTFTQSKIKQNKLRTYLDKKHDQTVDSLAIDEFLVSKIKRAPVGMLGKIIMRTYFPKWFYRLAEKGTIRNNL